MREFFLKFRQKVTLGEERMSLRWRVTYIVWSILFILFVIFFVTRRFLTQDFLSLEELDISKFKKRRESFGSGGE